jgi:hypothetical protein
MIFRIYLLKRNLLMFLFLLLVCGETFSQKATENLFRKNTFYLELGGKGPFYSVNYERIFHQRVKVNYSICIGFSIVPDGISLPLGLAAITGKKKHHAEFSLGATPFIQHYKSFLAKNDLSDKVIYIALGIGYRYQKPEGGIYFTFGVTPLLFIDPPSDNPWNISTRFYPSGHLGLGWNF